MSLPLVGYPDSVQFPPFIHSIFAGMQRIYGKVFNSYRVMAHNPEVVRFFVPCAAAILKQHALSNRIKELAVLKVTLINGCRY